MKDQRRVSKNTQWIVYFYNAEGDVLREERYTGTHAVVAIAATRLERKLQEFEEGMIYRMMYITDWGDPKQLNLTKEEKLI